MKEWQVTPLHKLGRIITGKTPPCARPESWGDGVPFLTPSDFDGGRIVVHYDRRLSPTGQKIMSRMIIPYGVAVSCIGWQMGKAVWVREPTVTNQQINSIIFDPKKVDGLFLYYNMKNRREELFRLASGGSRTPILKKSLFENLEVLHPPLEEQRAIGHILGTLDDKIEANRRMNRTMEAMAQALFRSWFVDFEPVIAKREGRKPVGMDDTTASLFPEHFQETDMGPIPLGWSYGTLSDLAKITSGKRPGLRSTTRTPDMVIPIFGGGGVMGYTDQALCTNKMLLTGRVGTLGLIFRLSEPCWPSDNTLLLTCADRDHEYVYQVIQDVDFDSLNRGSTQPLVTQGDLLALKILLPSSEILEKYHAITVNLFNKIDRNKNSIDTLAALRDTLLPQLLSGEFRVGQAEKIIGEA